MGKTTVKASLSSGDTVTQFAQFASGPVLSDPRHLVGTGSDAPVPFANKPLVEVDRHRNKSYLARNVIDRKQQ